MYDRSSMQRAASYSYPQYAAPAAPKQYPTAQSTSSAFSASANPNEDWTKISDLAERRRIQNRIAQRNYRKKLKKRLEDLERRAGSSSASPEQRHEELAVPETSSPEPSTELGKQRQRSSSNQLRRDRTPEVFAQQYVLPSDDRSMFSQQYTRQLSTSPPPFSYATVPSNDATTYSTYPPQATGYYSMPGGRSDMALYPQYYQSYQHVVPSMTTPPIKQEYYNEDDMSPFSLSYASMAGIDVSAAHSYPDMGAYTPPLSESFDHSQAGSPPDSTACPRTPCFEPRTPPMQVYDR